jgi:membrane-bound metal-dependent hydrolase YbcI (DUF457 family)
MMAPTHVLGGVAAWLAGCALAGAPPPVTALGLGLAAAGGLAPDIDHQRAEAAQFCRAAGGVACAVGLAAALSPARGHPQPWFVLAGAGALVGLLPWLTRPHGGGYRGFVHSLWGVGAVAALGGAAYGLAHAPLWAVAAFGAGWLSHLVLDALTREGLRLCWPSQIRYGWFPKAASMRTGGRKPGHRGRGPAGLEYVLVQPALIAVAITAGWLAVTGGSL